MAIAVPWQSGCVSLAWVWGEQPKAHCGGLAARLEHLNCITAHAVCVEREHKHWYSLAPPIPQSSHRAWKVLMIPQPSLCSLSLFHVLCTSCSINPQSFFRRNCSICGCIFGVFMGGCEFRVILCQHLRTLSLNPFYKLKNHCNS